MDGGCGSTPSRSRLARSLLTFGFFAARNGGAVIMCALSFAGLIAARLAGFSNRPWCRSPLAW